MKIIEALKRVKMNKEKVLDLRKKIANTSAHLSHETPMYPETMKQVESWLQTCMDISRDNAQLLVSIQKTNLATSVAIEIGGRSVTKCIAEWVWRRREYAKMDLDTWAQLTDRNLKEGLMAQSTGSEPMKVSIVRNYNPVERDNAMSIFREEPHLIDSALEIVNATTDLVE